MRCPTVFERHGVRTGRSQKPENWYKWPVAGKRNPDAVIGPDEPIARPYYCKYFDCEIELGLYIGKQGRNIPIDKATEYIAGYTIYNDVSCRDLMGKDGMPGEWKSKDFCEVMGPCMVTPDEIDETNLKVFYKVDGKVWYEGNTGIQRNWYSPEIVSYCSDNETLYPGDFIGSGTIDYGCCLEIGRFLEPGNVVEFEIEGIGVLRNPVIQGEPGLGYVSNGLPGHLKYKGPHTEEKPLLWETDTWKNAKAPPEVKI